MYMWVYVELNDWRRREWHAWDALYSSENDAVDAFPATQTFVVFVVADGGVDLERFEVRGFREAVSMLLQVRPAIFFNIHVSARLPSASTPLLLGS